MALSAKAAKAFKSPAHHKFAATVDEEGRPNVVPLLSARLIEDDTIAFVRFMVWKTKTNFERNGKLTFGCKGPGGRTYIARCRFERWEDSGPLLESFESEPIYRYNAYSGANVVGVTRVLGVDEYGGSGFLAPFLFSPSRARAKPTLAVDGPMPVQVAEKWGKLFALKFLGMADDQGAPLAIPHQGIFARGRRSLIFPMPGDGRHPLVSLKKGAPLAASVMTLAPVAYQVKGRFAGVVDYDRKPFGVMTVDEVYLASPPTPGKRIYPAGS